MCVRFEVECRMNWYLNGGFKAQRLRGGRIST